MAIVQLQRGALDLDHNELQAPDGPVVHLTSLESGVLAYLTARPGQIVARDELLVEVWGYAATTSTRAVDTTMARLRRKVERDPRHPFHLITVHGTGYRFVPLVTAPEVPSLVVGRRAVDLERRTVLVDGQTTVLTEAQAALLARLAEARGRSVFVETLCHEVFDRGPSARRALVAAIYRLRQLLEDVPTEPRHLCTTEDGYRLVARRPGERQPPPTPSGPFVGRETLLANVRTALDAHRIVTLVGIGGIGKTRLAAEVARAEPEDRLVVWVSLSGRSTEHELFEALALALGGAVEAPALAARLDEIDGLVVLDEAEGVAAHLAPLLGHGPHLLVTSRRAVGHPDEHTVLVDPLAPAAARRLLGEPAGDGVDLLVERLEGIPLAIVLAARRLGRVSAQELADRMDHRLQLLDGGEGRQRSLQTVLADTWDTLDPEARTVWAQASMLPGGFDLATAEAVIACEAWVIDPLDRLVDHGLVQVDPGATPTRYAMLETVRQFGVAQLSEPDRPAVVARLRAWATAAVRDHLHFVSEGAFVHDWPNLLAAWDPDAPDPALTRVLARYVLHRRGGDAAIAMVEEALTRCSSMPLAIERVGLMQQIGRTEEARRGLEALHPDDPRDQAERSALLGLNAYRRGAPAEALRHARDAMTAVGAGRARRQYTAMVVGALLGQGEVEEAAVLLAPLLREADPERRSRAHFLAASVSELRGDLVGAVDHTHQAIAADPSPVKRAQYRTILAEYLTILERFDDADDALRRAEVTLRRWPDAMVRSAAAGARGLLAVRQGRFDDAAEAFVAAEASSPDADGDAWCQLWLAAIRARQGDLDRARAHAARAGALPNAAVHEPLRQHLAVLWGEDEPTEPYTARDARIVAHLTATG